MRRANFVWALAVLVLLALPFILTPRAEGQSAASGGVPAALEELSAKIDELELSGECPDLETKLDEVYQDLLWRINLISDKLFQMEAQEQAAHTQILQMLGAITACTCGQLPPVISP